MNRFLVVAGLIILGTAVVFLGRGVNQNAVPEPGEDAPPKQSQPKQSPPGTPLPGAAGSPGAVTRDPAEETVGDPATAKRHFLVGWVYDEANEAKPETLAAPLQAVRDYVGRGGTVSAEIVDLDVPQEDRSPGAQAVTDLGVSLDGRALTDGNPSDAPGAVEAALKAIK